MDVNRDNNNKNNNSPLLLENEAAAAVSINKLCGDCLKACASDTCCIVGELNDRWIDVLLFVLSCVKDKVYGELYFSIYTNAALIILLATNNVR